ncbi:Mediator of RNA polymerase II transcription [Heracleum sosnowskyi]|uniref:Mediator of RNA polymerase II transcription n=1 Tax=Heracleum sosnowskyi TaxID=360622 RepID=A0AAD8MVQ9_9APIA|nr:Mediator of RNA polymerase II transcription [Heracleum sosnowskyi]
MDSESLDFLDDKREVDLTNDMVVNAQPKLDANHEDTTELSGSDFKGEDDAVRAGGFGARDDIGSFLPVASDFTDFEASLRDARDYEDPKEEIGRPGLGWAEVKKQK